MVERLGRGSAAFDFSVQLQVDPVAMPIENPGVRWDETVSPFRKVATLTIPSQPFDTPARRKFGDNLSFNHAPQVEPTVDDTEWNGDCPE